jgi:ABC-2 type transport system permease protein
MRALLRKEIIGFLGSLTGYIVITIFLLALGLLLWVFNSDFNILQSGYAGIDQLFILSPWVFMFLIPAITMRSFAEEKRTGTIELLLTQPLTEWEIVIAKYLSGLFLVLLSILPTLIYFYSIYQLGNPVGNIDTGATIGSFIGLLLIGSIYVGIGLFASSIADNQIISFLLALFLCFIFYIGFDSIAGLTVFKSTEHIISQIGIASHYNSISRGIIDSRDLVYFLSVTFLFIAITRYKLMSRKW